MKGYFLSLAQRNNHLIEKSLQSVPTFYQPFTLTLSIVLIPFVGLPHTHSKYVQHVHNTSKAYAYTQTAATALYTAINKQNQTSKPNT